MDTNRVEARFADGFTVVIDCIAVEDEYGNTPAQRAELDWLLYNKPLEYFSCSNCNLEYFFFNDHRDDALFYQQQGKTFFHPSVLPTPGNRQAERITQRNDAAVIGRMNTRGQHEVQPFKFLLDAVRERDPPQIGYRDAGTSPTADFKSSP